MRRVSYEELKIRTQCRAVPSPYYFVEFVAYDTETIDGKAILICDNNKRVCKPQNFEDCIRFLTPNRYRGTVSWFYNIGYDVEAILKWLSMELIKELADTGEIRNLKLKNISTTISVVDKKFFSITRNKHQFISYDISNFLPGGLDKNAKKYLGIDRSKIKIPINFETDSNTKIRKFIMSKKGISYCQNDAELTADLAKAFVKKCNEFNIFSKNYSSPASLATHYYQSHIDIPTLNQISDRRKISKRLAYDAYKGGFIEAFKKGYFPKVTLYDINSAYPYAMTKLLNMIHGTMICKLGDIDEKADMGWIECYIETKDNSLYSPAYFSPIPYYIKKFNKNFFLSGRIRTTITLLEYKALKNDFNITPIVSSLWYAKKKEYLYKKVIEDLYRLRMMEKDITLNKLLKTLLNGFYGKLIQKIPKKIAGSVTYNQFTTGNLFNPFHASYITAHCRIQIYNMIKKTGAHKVISVMTDSILYEDDPNIKVFKKLGSWSKDFEGRALMIGSGIYTLKNNNQTKTACRGFRLTSDMNFFKLCNQFYNDPVIYTTQKIRLSYREALRVKNFLGWNIINPKPKKININCDNKRLWSEDFKKCGDVLEKSIDSQPLHVIMK